MNKNIIYGKNAVHEALRAERQLEKIFIAQGMKWAPIQHILQEAKRRKIPVKEMNRRKLSELAGSDAHQGIVAVAAEVRYGTIEEMIARARQQNILPRIALLDEIQDPHNLGAIIRSAEAMGLHGVVIPQNRSAGLTETVAKTSAGAIHHLPVARITNLARTIDELKEDGFWILGADQNGEQVIHEISFDFPLGIVIGSEGKGMRRLIREKCDFIVRIPLHGKVNSLNASVAASILFWETVKK